MTTTRNQYIQIIGRCKKLFANKMKDYGCAWRILRLESLKFANLFCISSNSTLFDFNCSSLNSKFCLALLILTIYTTFRADRLTNK